MATATRARIAVSAPNPIHRPRWLLAARAPTGLPAGTATKGGGAAAATGWKDGGGGAGAVETGVNPAEVADSGAGTGDTGVKPGAGTEAAATGCADAAGARSAFNAS